MTAKEYLEQAYRLTELINSDLEELEKLRSLSKRISSPGFEENFNCTKNTDPPFVRCIEDIVELEQQINDEVEYLVKTKKEIHDTINSVRNISEKLLLRYRYINFHSWEEICIKLKVSMRTVRRLHSIALQHLKIPI